MKRRAGCILNVRERIVLFSQQWAWYCKQKSAMANIGIKTTSKAAGVRHVVGNLIGYKQPAALSGGCLPIFVETFTGCGENY